MMLGDVIGYRQDLNRARAEGETKGRAEVSEEIVRKMKKEHADFNFISRVISLPVERIAQL